MCLGKFVTLNQNCLTRLIEWITDYGSQMYFQTTEETPVED